MTTEKGIPIFIASEQPEACRFCGSRTDFTEWTAVLQIHTCPSCHKSYRLEFEEELV